MQKVQIGIPNFFQVLPQAVNAIELALDPTRLASVRSHHLSTTSATQQSHASDNAASSPSNTAIAKNFAGSECLLLGITMSAPILVQTPPPIPRRASRLT